MASRARPSTRRAAARRDGDRPAGGVGQDRAEDRPDARRPSRAEREPTTSTFRDSRAACPRVKATFPAETREVEDAEQVETEGMISAPPTRLIQTRRRTAAGRELAVAPSAMNMSEKPRTKSSAWTSAVRRAVARRPDQPGDERDVARNERQHARGEKAEQVRPKTRPAARTSLDLPHSSETGAAGRRATAWGPLLRWFYDLKYRAFRRESRPRDGRRGLVVLQIDALSYADLRRAIALGYCPTISRLLHDEGLHTPTMVLRSALGHAVLPGGNLSRGERGHSRVSILRQGNAARDHLQRAARGAVYPRSHCTRRARWRTARAT